MSPAQAEELLRKVGYRRGAEVEFLEPVVVRPPGKPVLARDTDSRPAYIRPDENVFDDLTADSL